MLGNPFRLRSTLSASARSNKNDIRNVKQVFGSLGYLTPQTRQSSKRPDDALFEGIRRFQSDHGLKSDGVMKPGGETEQAISTLLEKKRNGVAKPTSSLVVTAELDHGPSLLDPFPSRTPGIIPETGKRGTPNDRHRTRKLGQEIRKLLELIVQKTKDNEVVAEGTRTVKAALKTSDHTDLAKFHATAVKDFGDDALAEIAEFGNQLKKANPKVFNSWLNIFSKELPGDAERMMLAVAQDEDVLEGGTGEDAFKAKEQGKADENAISLPPIPSTKKDWFKGKEHEWEEFHKATAKLPGVTKNEHAAYMHIFGQEGGHKKNEESTASAGLLQRTADIYLGEGELKSIPKGTPTEKLSADTKVIIYREYLDDEFPKIGGHKVLDDIGDELGATALAEGAFRLGHDKASDVIQLAMRKIDPTFTDIDKIFGSKTLTKYKELVRSPEHRSELLNMIADGYTKEFPNEARRFDTLRPSPNS